MPNNKTISVECSRCGDPIKVADADFAEALQKGEVFTCTDCAVFLKAQNDIDIGRGMNVPSLAMPTTRGKFRWVQRYTQMEEQPDGSHKCPYCGTTLWRAIFMTRGTVEGVPTETESTDTKSEVFPKGTLITLDECPSPHCEMGWGAVRNAKRYENGDDNAPMPRRFLDPNYLPDMAPPWSGSEEKHFEFWAKLNATTQAGKGVGVGGMFGGAGIIKPSN